MAGARNQESEGFKLLEEDALDDRPCPAVKKFVSSVLNRRDLKDRNVATSYRNLTEYRDPSASPRQSRAAMPALEECALDHMPTSPTMTLVGPGDDQRLPNELLDEICEDMGMKEGMELDLVEFLMEQDTNSQACMSQEVSTPGAYSRWTVPPHPQTNYYAPNLFHKAMYPSGTYPSHHPHQQTGMGLGHVSGPPATDTVSVCSPVDSSLDQGYFSGESTGTYSSGSAPSPAFTSSSLSSFSSSSTIMPANQSPSSFQNSSKMQRHSYYFPPIEYGKPSDHVSSYGMGQYSSVQQQQPPHQQQHYHPSHLQQSSSLSSETMPPLSHVHMQQTVQQQQYLNSQQHQFASSSHTSESNFETPQQSSMQISTNDMPANCQIPLAMSTPGPSKTDPNSCMGKTYGSSVCPPACERPFGSGNHPNTYTPVPSGQNSLYPGQGLTSAKTSQHHGWRSSMVGGAKLSGDIHHSSSSMKGTVHELSPMQPNHISACSAPVGSETGVQDAGMIDAGVNMVSGFRVPPNMGPHPDCGPCMCMNCGVCKTAHAHSPGLPHMSPCQYCKMSHSPPRPSPLPYLGPYPGPNNATYLGPGPGPNCKMNHASRPQMLSSQQKFIQHLIMDEGNSAYRSHPLFPLLRDLVIAEMNFDNPQFHYQQLLSFLPNDFHKLLQNFLHRNPPSGHYESNQAIESVIMDSLRLAHCNLVEKIRQRQEMEKMKSNSSASLRSMEELCQKFDHSVTGPVGRPVPNGVGTMVPLGHHMGGYHQEGSYLYRTMKGVPDLLGGEAALSAAGCQANRTTESKKHPSLPKEAVAIMLEWLRDHKDNPYPNDDEKGNIIKQTGLSINQINYWFTNARRRILPKWAQCKK